MPEQIRRQNLIFFILQPLHQKIIFQIVLRPPVQYQCRFHPSLISLINHHTHLHHILPHLYSLCSGTGAGVSVGVTVGVIVGVTVGIAVGVTVGVAVGSTVGSPVGVGVGVAVGVGVVVSVGVGVGDGVAVGVGPLKSILTSAGVCVSPDA